MPVGFGNGGVKTEGRPVSVLAHLKRSVVEVKAEENCLAHALVIAVAKLENDHKYTSYRRGCKIGPAVQQLLEKSGIELKNGGAGLPELIKFQLYSSQYRIVVYSGLRCDNIMFDGQVEAPKG